MCCVCSKQGASRGTAPSPACPVSAPGRLASAVRSVGLSLCSLHSAKKSRGQPEPWWRWLKAACLLCLAALGGLLSWSCLSAEDGVTEVLAPHSENLQGKFIEIPCSEDYDSHKRFEAFRRISCLTWLIMWLTKHLLMQSWRQCGDRKKLLGPEEEQTINGLENLPYEGRLEEREHSIIGTASSSRLPMTGGFQDVIGHGARYSHLGSLYHKRLDQFARGIF